MSTARNSYCAPCAAGPLADRVVALRADIASALEKERRLTESIRVRQTTLNRLQVQLALNGDVGAARSAHGR
jgi:hypothetical protein